MSVSFIFASANKSGSSAPGRENALTTGWPSADCGPGDGTRQREAAKFKRRGRGCGPLGRCRGYSGMPSQGWGQQPRVSEVASFIQPRLLKWTARFGGHRTGSFSSRSPIRGDCEMGAPLSHSRLTLAVSAARS
ncbi:hypothetical protein MRX96_003659 [Rhipicephalus microplus]